MGEKTLLNAYLSSQKFMQQVNELSDPAVAGSSTVAADKLTYAAVRWHLLFENPWYDCTPLGLGIPTAGAMNDFMRRAVQVLRRAEMAEDSDYTHGLNRLLIKEARTVLRNTPQRDEKLVALFTMAAAEFHGFNGAFEKNIRRHGLNPRTKTTPSREIMVVDNIFRRAGTQLGYAACDTQTVSLTNDLRQAIRHARMSPEWFHIATGFRTDNYTAAKNNFLNVPNPFALSHDDKTILENFFDRNWALLANQIPPKFFMRSQFRAVEDLQEQIDLNLQYLQHWGAERTLNEICASDLYARYETRYFDPIDTREGKFVTLTEPHALERRLKIQQEFAPDTLTTLYPCVKLKTIKMKGENYGLSNN